VTKYHKEEWQAAWTIRTMLEAIIAFFPIREDHDAIGAIDYPLEARKKLATQSRKWKCDICGPIIDVLPDKPKQEVVNPIVSSNPSHSNEIVFDNSSKEGDNKSDSSNTIYERQETSTDNKPVKREKSSKMKKIELDRKSLLSNIEGVIFEDINEDAENEEEVELTIKRRQTEFIDNGKIIDQNMKKLENHNNIQLSNLNSEKSVEIKRSNSDNTGSQPDFSEYFKRLRQSQFESSEVSNKVEEKEISLTEEPEITFKNKDKIFLKNIPINKNDNVESQNVPTIQEKIKVELNPFREHTIEEIEFYNIISTLKIHKSKTSEELLKELYEESDKNTKVDKKDRESMIGDVLNKLLEQANKKGEISDSSNKNLSKQQIQEMISLFSGQDKLESLLKQKNNAMKYVTRKTYKEAKTKRLRIINFFMVFLIIAIFGIYWYSKNHS
jgi:hypothetical protein